MNKYNVSKILNMLEELELIYNEETDVNIQNDIEAFNKVKEEISLKISDVEQWAISIENSKLYSQQIIDTKDNLIKLIFNSYYKDIRVKQYKNLFNSCLFILKQLDEERLNE